MAQPDSRLPVPVRQLIDRKLRLLRKELDQTNLGILRRVQERLTSEMRERLRAGAMGKMLTSVPIDVFQEITGNAMATTQSWPMAVWQAISGLLDQAGVYPQDGVELNAIVDEHAWTMEPTPFPLEYVGAERFRNTVARVAASFGLGQDEGLAAFDRQIQIRAAAAKAGIMNSARHAREAVAIAIEEYVIARAAADQPLSESIGTAVEGKMAAQELASSSSPYAPLAIFRDLAKLSSDEVQLAFVGDKAEDGIGANNMLEICARGTIKRVPLSAIDLVNRTSGQLNSQGVILLGLAGGGLLKSPEKNSKKVSRLREVLRTHLGVRDDPFDAYQQGIGWRPRFKILDKRGGADERAKREAERRTVPLEHLSEFHPLVGDFDDCAGQFEEDEADAWLKDHEPGQSL